ncbi:TPR-like protein [Vararia minispora EC-137]|uniref:TPR-like protein n=1 Tax=Vararia minispora EC-137 TaxID=1314806 RepID=A0ACB8QYH0_9AGAM|nr:TPR-like protein [Vararia minispora EC-137]
MAVAVNAISGEMVDGLRAAVKESADRGLHYASKWAAELLASTPTHKRRSPFAPPPSILASTPARTPGSMAPPQLPTPALSAVLIPERNISAWGGDTQADEDEDDVLNEGMACFQAREFARASHILKECRTSRGRFLRVYSQYLATPHGLTSPKASEKKAIQNWNKLDGTRRQPSAPINTSLLELYEIATGFKADTDPWLLFLRGLLLHRLGRRAEAIEMCLLSLKLYIWNWSVWVLLSDMIDDAEELSGIFPLIPVSQTHPLVQFFQIRTLNALHQPTENELGICERLLSSEYFPHSLWVMSLRACILYHLHDFGQAEVQFQKILEIDPYRIDDIDIYSNILYVTENRLKLSKLAHDFINIDRDRPEVCCLIGNHYSLRAEHEKAIKYFRRATDLDRTYLSAWTLMGHEYVEMKNSHAAIEAYRRAVDVNRKDYRAWFGLGQAYELLNMHQYALYYYQHATALRPYDVRLWQAQGGSYEEMGRFREAIECYKRALLGADVNEVTIDLKIAKLHDELGQYMEAASYHRRVIDLSLAALKPIAEYARSAVYLARYHLYRGGGDLVLALQLMEKVAGSNSEEADAAQELVKEITAKIAAKQRGGGSGGGGRGLERMDTANAATMNFVQ